MMKPPNKTFTVATFWHVEGGKGRASAYTTWYSRAWPGCVMMEIEATSGREAVRLAKARRKQMEQRTS